MDGENYNISIKTGILGIFPMASDRAKANTSTARVQFSKGSGKTVKKTMVSSFCLTAIYSRENLETIVGTTGYTGTGTGMSMKAIGRMKSRMEGENLNQRMEKSMKAILNPGINMDTGSTSGWGEMYTRASSTKTRDKD